MLNTKIEKRNISKINCFGLFAKEIVFKDEIIWAPTNDAFVPTGFTSNVLSLNLFT